MKIVLPGILFLLACSGSMAAERLAIGRIQGANLRSPYEGQVVTTQGIVTRVYQNGFIIQSQKPDSAPETSEAVYVFQEDTKVVAGNEVEVTGKVEEWMAGKEDSYNQPLTQIRADRIRPIRRRSTLPKPVELNHLMSDFPAIIKRPGSSFDPRQNALDFWESMEHMRVMVMDAVVIGPRTRYGEIAIRVPQAPPEPATPRGGAKLTGYYYNPPRILVALAPENEHPYNTGDQIQEPILGNLTYSYGTYRIGSSKSIGKAKPGTPVEKEPLPAIPEGSLRFSTFNVENLYTELPDAKFESLARIIVGELQAPDIVALQEIHDNSGPSNDGTVDAFKTMLKLTRFIKSAGGPSYRFIQLNPGNNADGGWPGANIRNAYLYRDTVVVGHYKHLEDPVFDKDDSREYTGTRKPLIAYFTHGKDPYIFINCHLRSKGGDSPTYGSLLPAIRFTDRQRIAQTRVIRSQVNNLASRHPDAGIIVLGDLNDFEFSESVRNLTREQGLVNLIDRVPLEERYSYIYQGYSQVLDHILVSPHLAPKVGIRMVHVNSDFSEHLRASDHDPILAWIKP